MNIQAKQNIEEKIRLILIESISSLEKDFEGMLRRHAADGLLRSGNTIKATMNMIADLSANLYSEILSHIDVLSLKYYSTIETDIADLARAAQEKLKVETIAKFQKSTEMAGKPKLYERMLPEVEAEMANNLATFQNNLNAKIIEIKQSTQRSPLEKVLWLFEIIILVTSIFVSGMWFKDPQGNYEPVVVALTLVMPLIYLVIRRISKQ
ncbi:MAG: hypothetical protein COA47_14725 [Robiginitomaculum sp.]|nr:MAG: hypothetical protein COA47_14725 [Robiginitomaculum sp.]